MVAATTDNLRENAPRDANDVLRVPIVRLTLVLPGVVDCSLAVTNNSPVCLLILYYSVFPSCKPFNLAKIQASKCRAVFYSL